jgi:hypothetical protein
MSSSLFEICPTSEFSDSDYFIATLGKDAWKKGLEALIGEAALLAVGLWFLIRRLMIYLGMREREYFPHNAWTSLLDYLPFPVILLLGGTCIFVFVLMFREMCMYLGPMMHIRIADTKLGQSFLKQIGEKTNTAREAMEKGFTTAFYFCVVKGYEHVRFDDRSMVVSDEAGSYENHIRYARIYKVFLPGHRRFLVLRCKWNGGPRDVIADLASLGESEQEALLQFLSDRIDPSARCYGNFGKTSMAHLKGRFKKYDPWDAWSYKKPVNFRPFYRNYLAPIKTKKQWANWRLPADAPIR